MALKNGVCPNCGAQQSVETSLKAAVCTVCKSAYVVKDAFHHGSVTEDINQARAYLNVGQMNKAKVFFRKAYAQDPDNEELKFLFNFPYQHNVEQYCKQHPNIEHYEREYLERVIHESWRGQEREIKSQREKYFKFFFDGMGNRDIYSQCVSRCDMVCKLLGGLPEVFENEERYSDTTGQFVFFKRKNDFSRVLRSMEELEYLFSRDARKIFDFHKKITIYYKHTTFWGRTEKRAYDASVYDAFAGNIDSDVLNNLWGDTDYCICPAILKDKLVPNQIIATLILKYYPL